MEDFDNTSNFTGGADDAMLIGPVTRNTVVSVMAIKRNIICSYPQVTIEQHDIRLADRQCDTLTGQSEHYPGVRKDDQQNDQQNDKFVPWSEIAR